MVGRCLPSPKSATQTVLPSLPSARSSGSRGVALLEKVLGVLHLLSRKTRERFGRLPAVIAAKPDSVATRPDAMLRPTPSLLTRVPATVAAMSGASAAAVGEGSAAVAAAAGP